MGVASTGAVISKGTTGLLGKLLKIKIAYIIVIILFIQAVSVGLANGGGIEIVKQLGERFFSMTQNLQEISLAIIESGGVFDSYLSLGATIWKLFSNIYIIYLWLKLFEYLSGKSPWSNESDSFKNISFAIFTFLILQVFYLFLFSEPLPGQNKFDMIKTPVLAFVDFVKAVIIIFTSTTFDKATQINSSFVCNDPAGCVI